MQQLQLQLHRNKVHPWPNNFPLNVLTMLTFMRMPDERGTPLPRIPSILQVSHKIFLYGCRMTLSLSCH